jgi:hypothetical protein
MGVRPERQDSACPEFILSQAGTASGAVAMRSLFGVLAGNSLPLGPDMSFTGRGSDLFAPYPVLVSASFAFRLFLLGRR